jgi:hypothetical protein
MTQDAPQPAQGLPRNRRALLGVYAALDSKLRAELRSVGVEFDEGPMDPFDWLERAVDEPEEPGRPRPHRLHLAFAAMRALRAPAPPGPQDRERLHRVAARLSDPEAPTDIDTVDTIATALERAASTDVPDEQRWAQVVQEAGPQLHPELRAIKDAWCHPELRQVDDEFVSRIETRLVVQSPRTIEELAPAVLPGNWKVCNDFFCDLIRAPERDGDCPGATTGDPSAATTFWRGVYEERVGSCPAGWFPDTYLLFTWECSENQVILCYELTPRRRSDRTVLAIDEGYIQVDRLPGAYQVSTLKYLLFDDEAIPGGGQTLGQAACQLGWLDYSINQFTACAANLAAMTGTVATPPAGEPKIDADVQRVLDRCQAHLLETASDADAQLTRVMAKLRDGSYSLDDCVGDWGAVLACGVRDGARSVQDQLDLALRTVDVARTLLRRQGART